MLNQDTKRKIDSARQILVGKVPDPKAQVEQITTALIYKFMDDMDKESQELGGKARYFIKDYEKYAWTKLMDAKLGGQDRLNLYFEALSNLGRNQHMPQLFRDIFGDKSLPPYRDTQTLTLFLKEINGFNFDHSEDLGDAYEYLLNVIGTSGEAGQFRTPRHLIDFIVAAVAPKKDNTICDPACGTAGFLISAYKYILKQHDGLNDPKNGEKPLTPDEKKNLMNHFVGYDIDPGMVRIATVNMYLHNFPEPKIFEYDTLTYEDRWDENFDVILANPPFMTPTGGIRPHKRFSVQANRSEVLFVDYILEHLRPNGRAGIIVPEGIIFRNDTAYKKLRKKLVEDGLYAVVSLPQGVFAKPGGKGNVKTSILFFDNQLAKKSNEILFVKVENDGFDLGAQRRKIDKNDLPQALKILDAWKNGTKRKSDLALWIRKEKIAESGNYRLSSEFYRENINKLHQKWPMVELGQVLDYEQPTKYIVDSVDYDDKYSTPVLTAGKTFILGYTNEKSGIFSQEKLPVIIFDDFTTASKFVDFPFKVKSSAMKILLADKSKANIKFLFHLMQRIVFTINEHKRYWISEYSRIKIPLPPIEIQKEIIEQIEVKQNAIDAAKAVIDNLERERRYFGQSLRKIKDVEWVELGNMCDIKTGKKDVNHSTPDGKYQFFTCALGQYKSPDYAFDTEAILLPGNGANVGKVFYFRGKFQAYQRTYVLLNFKNKILGKFLYHYLSAEWNNYIKSRQFGSATNYIVLGGLQKFKIPLPPIETQKQLVAEMEEQEKIIEANKKLVGIMEQKITEVLSEI